MVKMLCLLASVPGASGEDATGAAVPIVDEVDADKVVVGGEVGAWGVGVVNVSPCEGTTSASGRSAAAAGRQRDGPWRKCRRPENVEGRTTRRRSSL